MLRQSENITDVFLLCLYSVWRGRIPVAVQHKGKSSPLPLRRSGKVFPTEEVKLEEVGWNQSEKEWNAALAEVS